jgi:hypothetical protein
MEEKKTWMKFYRKISDAGLLSINQSNTLTLNQATSYLNATEAHSQLYNKSVSEKP